ncbi:hypothetical protein Tco_0110484 [Tanacetum coccineum]
MEERFYNVQNKLEAMRAESACKHEELINLLKKFAISIGCAKEVEEWGKWRDLKRAQEASEDIISNPKSQTFVTEDCDDGSRPEEQHLVVPCSDEEIVKFLTQHAATEISGEDGSNLEEFSDVLTVEEADIMGPIMAVEDEPLMMLRSDPNIIKEDFSNDLDGQRLTDERMAANNSFEDGLIEVEERMKQFQEEILIQLQSKLEECFTRFQIKVEECFTQVHQEYSLWSDKLFKSVEVAVKEKKGKLIQAKVKEKKIQERQVHSYGLQQN